METIQDTGKDVYQHIDLFGPTLLYLISPADAPAPYSIMRSSMSPGTVVPLHSHPDEESFYILSGHVQVFIVTEDSSEWQDLEAGDFVHINSNIRHAWRNISGGIVESVTVTTPRMGNFFLEAGRRVLSGETTPPPTAADLQKFLQVAGKYGHWMANAKENEAIGIPDLTKSTG